MATPLWRQIIEGTYDPFASSFDRRSGSSGGFEGLDTDWRAFRLEQEAERAAERQLAEEERAALEARGQEYVNLAGAERRIETAAGVAEAFGQPDIEPTAPAPAIEGIANVLDAAKSAVVGGLSGLMGWDIQADELDQTRIGTSRFIRQEDIVGDRNRLEVAWERALKGLFGGQSYGFGDFEALRYEQEDPRLERVAKGAAAFVFDVALDPLTYFSFGSSVLGRVVASTGVRAASKKVAAEALQRAGEATIRQQVERLGTRELAARVARVTGKERGDLILRTPSELADELARLKPSEYLEAAADSWSFGNAAAYGSRGRTGLYDRLVETVGTDIADDVWKKFDPDIRGGARIRVPFKRTVSEETGLRLPTVFQFPGSQPGRGFDKLGMGKVIRRMNEARLVLRTGPFKFLENVTGGRGRSWTKLHQAARAGDGEAIEAYAVYHHLIAYDDAARQMAAHYDQIASAGMQAIDKKLGAAVDRNLDRTEILEFVKDLYQKRGRSDVPVPSSPEHVIAVDIANHLFEMQDDVHQLGVEIYGEDAARKMEDYATRMLTPEGYQELVDRYGRLKSRRGRLVDSNPRLPSSYPKKMELDANGRLIVTEWMTPGEITQRTGQNLFIDDPIEAVGEYLQMMRRELIRDWSLKQLDELGLVTTIGEDVIRQPKIEKIQSEVQTRLAKVRGILDRVEKGEAVSETDQIATEAEAAAAQTIARSGKLVEVETGVWRSEDGLVEIRKNRTGGYSASVAGEPALRPSISQLQAEELVPELQGPVREVDWDQVRQGFYDADGNRIPARQVRMEGVDDPRWITSAEPPAPRRPGARPRPEPDDSREISGTWEPWLRSGSETDLEYVHKVLRHKVSVYENGGKSVSQRAYRIHRRDLEILEELHPHLRNLDYDAPIPQSASLPPQKYRIDVSPDGSWRIVENLQPGEVGATIVGRRNDIFELSNGRTVQISKQGDFWEAAEYDPETATVSLVARGTNKKSLTDEVIEMYSGAEAPTPTPTPTPPAADIPPLRSKTEIAEDIQNLEISWTKNGKIHTAFYEDFEINIIPVEKGSPEAARGEKYIQKVIWPNGQVETKASNANKLADAKRLAIEFLDWDVQEYERVLRDAAVRDAYDVWPGMSLVRGEPGDYQVVDLGDETTIFINSNNYGWFAGRKGSDFTLSLPGEFATREELLADLDELFPGISRVFDGELVAAATVPPAPSNRAGATFLNSRIIDFDDGRRIHLSSTTKGWVATSFELPDYRKRTVSGPFETYDELIDDLAAKYPGLGDPEVRGVLMPDPGTSTIDPLARYPLSGLSREDIIEQGLDDALGDLEPGEIFDFGASGMGFVDIPNSTVKYRISLYRMDSSMPDGIDRTIRLEVSTASPQSALPNWSSVGSFETQDEVVDAIVAHSEGLAAQARAQLAETVEPAPTPAAAAPTAAVAPEPEPIVPGLKRDYAGKYRYTKETGEQFDIEQVRPEGKAQVWRVTDAEGVEVGDFPRREDAVAFLEGREPRPSRAPVPPETRSLVQEFNRASREFTDLRQRIIDAAPRARTGSLTDAEREALQTSFDDLYNYMTNVIEILSFDNPTIARRLLSRVPDLEDLTADTDVVAVLSDLVEDVTAKAPRRVPRGGLQEGFGVAPAVGGPGEVFTPPVPRSDFVDRDEAAYWANRVANRVREPRAKIVRDEIWERNRAELIKRLQEDATWLEAAVSDGILLRNAAEEDFETWVERVITFLDGVDPSIDPYDNAIDKRRYSEAARAAGIERFSTEGVDPVVAAIITSQDLFGPEMVAESIKRHFSLRRDLEAADRFYENFWRPYYTASKSWMTQGRGYGYTARNIIGSMYNAWLADVRPRHFKHSGALLAARREARKNADEILARRGVQEGESTVEAWERIFDAELRRHLKDGVGGFAGLRDNVAELVADSYQLFTARNYGGRTARSRTWGDILDRGTFDSPVYGAGEVGRKQAELFPGRSIEELTRAQRIANTTIDNPWMRHVTRVNESAEDYLRFAAFLRGVDTYGLDDGGFAAGTWVVGTQFDYASLSDFERRVMKNIIPFYTWTRYNVPLQIRSLWMQPGKVNRLLRFHEEVMKAWTGESKEDETSLPEWLRRRGGWMTTMSAPLTDPETVLGEIFGFKEDPIAAFIESPLSDLGMLFNATLNPLQIVNMDEVINNLNPILGRTAYELVTGRSYVSGRELDSDASAPRFFQPWALIRGRRNEDGELVFSQKWAQAFRNILPPFAQAERLFAPLMGDERQRRRWLTTVGSQVLAIPTYTVDPNQRAFALNSYAQGVQDALREGIISYEDRRDVALRLMDQGYEPEQIAQLGLSTVDPGTLNFEELARARRNVATEDQITSFLDTLPESVAEQFIFRRGFRGRTGVEAVEAWKNRQPIDELGALYLPQIDMAFADWFRRLTESEKLGFVFEYGYGPYRGAEAVQQWSARGGLPNLPAGMGSADFLS